MIAKVMRYAYMGLLILPGALCATPLIDRLEKAVEESDLIVVGGLLKELSSNGSMQEKKDVLGDMSLMSREVYAQLKKDRSLVHNAADVTRAFLGSLVTMTSAYYLSCYVYLQAVKDREWKNLPTWAKSAFMGVPALGAAIGGYYAYKGLTCSAQNKRIALARKVKKIIVNEQESLGQASSGK